MFASNIFASELIREIFEEIDSDSDLFLNARSKIYENIKTYKDQVLARMKIFKSRKKLRSSLISSIQTHILALIKDDPQLSRFGSDNDLLESHFVKTFNATNFVYVFKYMNEYLDVDKSSELEKFYMQGISNYLLSN